MLTSEDKEEIKRLVGEMIAARGPLPSTGQKHAGDPSQIAQIRDLLSDEGFTEVMFTNPATGESRVLKAFLGSDAIVDVTARAIEVFGTREEALRWLRTPVRSLGDRTPISLLNSPDGIARVQDTLGQVEHGVW
jgi:hypothetical protein